MNEVNYEQIKCLYAKRWEIEKSFDVLKNKLNMENIT
jgi:IS4 transposase